MTYEEKLKKYNSKSGLEMFGSKTPLDELPFEMKFGSSTHPPSRKGGMSTSDIVLWCKYMDSDWFRPYGNFGKQQILQMIDICKNDQQINSLMELLSATK